MGGETERGAADRGPSIHFFSRHWSRENLDQGHLAGFWDQRADSFNRHKKTPGSAEHRLEFSQKMVDRCGLGPQSRMLDVGCGSGHYALAFADQIGRVEGFDISPRMVEFARSNALNAGLSGKVDFTVLDWSRADLSALGWTKAFDLVMASRTPAVCDHSTLLKMMEASKRFCLLISLADQESTVRSALRKKVAREVETVRGNRSVYCAFNLLWLMGRYPEVSYLEQKWEDDLPVDEAAWINFRHFEQGGPLDEREKTLILEQLEEMAVGGLVHDSVEARIALLIWEV